MSEKKEVRVFINEEQIYWIDTLIAVGYGDGRSEVVRNLISEHLIFEPLRKVIEDKIDDEIEGLTTMEEIRKIVENKFKTDTNR